MTRAEAQQRYDKVIDWYWFSGWWRELPSQVAGDGMLGWPGEGALAISLTAA